MELPDDKFGSKIWICASWALNNFTDEINEGTDFDIARQKVIKAVVQDLDIAMNTIKTSIETK